MTWEDLWHRLRTNRAVRVRAAVLLVTAAALTVVLAACVAVVLAVPISRYRPTMTLDEAKARATTYAQAAQAQLLGSPRLIGPARTSVDCDGNAPRGSVDLADTYNVDYSAVPSPPSSTAIIDRMYNYWAFSGYVMLSDARVGATGRRITFENPKDGFRFGLVEPDVGSMLSLQISAPCVRPGP